MEITHVSAWNYMATVDLRRRDGAVFTAERTEAGAFTVMQTWRSGDAVQKFPAGAGDVVEVIRALSVADLTGWTVRVPQGGFYASPPEPAQPADVSAWAAPEFSDDREMPF